MPARFRLIEAPAGITVLGKPYYYYWDDTPDSSYGPMTSLGNYGSLVCGPDGRVIDGDSPAAARAALHAAGLREEKR